MIWVGLLLWWAPGAVPQQVQRGEALFTESGRGCLTCHALKGRGTAVGPDLSTIARLAPRAIAMGIRSSATQYVQAVKLKSGETFPGMPGASDEGSLQFFDLSKTPPELRRVDRSDVKAVLTQDAWKHPPAAGNYTTDQIADIVAYLRYAVTGNIKPVDAADVE